MDHTPLYSIENMMNSKFHSKVEINENNIRDMIKEKIKKIKNYTPRVGIFGVTGVGKSSLCNILFGKELAKVSDISACTRESQEIDMGGIVLIDVPGVGETIERDKEYFELYKELSPTLDLILWVIKADDRAYSIAEKAYTELLKSKTIEECPVIFVINQVDKIEPIFDEETDTSYWDKQTNEPKLEKKSNIEKKVSEIKNAFKVDANHIQTISVRKKYHITELMEQIIEVLPKEKKFSMYREYDKETRNKKMEETAEKGVWETLREWLGELWHTHKDTITKVATEACSVLFEKALKKFKFW